MPHIEARKVKFCLYSRDLTRVCDHDVLVTCLPALRRPRRSTAKALPAHYLKLHLMDVDRVGVLGKVENLPHFHGIRLGILGISEDGKRIAAQLGNAVWGVLDPRWTLKEKMGVSLVANSRYIKLEMVAGSDLN